MREHTDGEFPFANDFNAVVRDALAGSTLVESGCDVSDGGTNDLSLDVASGEAVVNGTDASVSSQSVSVSSGDSDPRYDLVVADSSGTASVVAGTASSTPQAPSIPSDSVLLAIVEVPAGASGVTDADIFDARAVLSGIPNSTVTQGSGSGLDADTLDGQEASEVSRVDGAATSDEGHLGVENGSIVLYPGQYVTTTAYRTSNKTEYGYVSVSTASTITGILHQISSGADTTGTGRLGFMHGGGTKLLTSGAGNTTNSLTTTLTGTYYNVTKVYCTASGGDEVEGTVKINRYTTPIPVTLT